MLKRNLGYAAVNSASHRASTLPQLEIKATRFRPSAQGHFEVALLVKVLEHSRPFPLVPAPLQELGTDELAENVLFVANGALHPLCESARGIAVDGDP